VIGKVGKSMGGVVGIIGVVILMIVFPIVMSATHDLQIDEQADAFAGVATGAGETDADVVLTVDLYGDDNTNVLSIVSSLETDVPVAGTYTAATNTLNVTGLTAESSRTLTVTYEIDALTSFTGMAALFGITPLHVTVSIQVIVIASTWYSFKKGG